MKQSAKLTDKMAKSAVCGPKELIIWDTDVKGLGLRLRPTGGKSWYFKRGDNKWTIGQTSEKSISTARSEALYMAREIEEGRTPPKKSRAHKPLISEMMEAYLADHVKVHRSDTTAKDYQGLIDNHINPFMGHLPIDTVSPRDIDRLIAKMIEQPYAVTKVVALLKAAFNMAMRWGQRSPALGNPCVKATLPDLSGREEYLLPHELKILLECFDEISHRPNRYWAAQCLRLLAVTGCRRDECRALEWAWIDWDRGKINWPSTKTGEDDLQLNAAALDVLMRTRGHGPMPLKPHVFRGLNHELTLPQNTLYRAWDEAKKLAANRGVDVGRLERLRPHDLRHTFASLGLAAGWTLEEVGRVLRHADQRTTKRYAHSLPSRDLALSERSMEFLPVVIDA